MLTSHLLIRRCGWSPEPCWDSPAGVHKHRHMGGQISTARSPAGGSLGLLQGSCPNLEAGESPGADTALTSGTSGSCSFPSHTGAALLSSPGTRSSLDWHSPHGWASFTPQPAPRKDPAALALEHSVTHFAFYTDTSFLSTEPSPA